MSESFTMGIHFDPPLSKAETDPPLRLLKKLMLSSLGILVLGWAALLGWAGYELARLSGVL